ncbi:MAG TPA: plastocyanin/azurin family copper-binding protein [Anaerolineaceae bacterium]|nr:plastocyanin/azurin family copper-binding protein [Anaerolineaceae bacterium]
MSRYRGIPRMAIILLPVLLLSACRPASVVSNESEDVQITLTDYRFETASTTFVVGVPYHFTLTNEGKIAHEFMIMKPIGPSMGMDMEELDEIALTHVDADELPADGSASVDYTFTTPQAAGDLEFACHIPGHYEAGMNLPITVIQP